MTVALTLPYLTKRGRHFTA